MRATARAYERGLDEFFRRWRGRRYRRPPWLAQFLDALPGDGLILDLGCGACQDVIELERLGLPTVGADILLPFLRRGGQGRRLRLVQADIRRLPFRDGGFRGIWAAASLIHLTKRDVALALKALRQSTRTDGVLALTLLHGRRAGRLRTGWIPDRYVSRWTKAEIIRTVERAGWVVREAVVVVNQERKGRWINLIAVRTR